MGLLLSNTERRQFTDALKMARDLGWPDSKIAKELRVTTGDVRNLAIGFQAPSPKHVQRLNELLRSTPPRSVPPLPPPVPDAPGTSPPPEQGGRMKLAEPAPQGRTIVFIGDDGGAPTPPRPPRQPKERTNMETTATNGVSHNTEAVAAGKNARYQLLQPAETKSLRRAMITTLKDKFEGDKARMAKEMQMSRDGFHKAVSNRKGLLSRLTLHQFTKLTGWAPQGGPAARPSKRSSTKSSTRATTQIRLSRAEYKSFQAELLAEVERVGTLSQVARAAGVNRSTFAFVLNGTGSTQKTRDVFQKYLDGKKPSGQATNGVKLTLRPVRATVTPPPEGNLDLYSLAGHLLSAGKPQQAYFLSLVARASELVPMEKLTQALAELTPVATSP